MSGSVAANADPLPFLQAEERHRDHQAREALFLTFNADLPFFETRLLGLCEGSGARTTIIADAHVWRPDTWGTHHAGSAYHVGLTAGAGAFHPKLILIAGPLRATVAVGSGNLTLGGWQYNDELWTVFTGDKTSVPAVFSSLGKWLGQLAASATLDDLARGALRRAAGELDGLCRLATTVDTGHVVVSSLARPIVDQLPEGPVDELLLYAPFHDPGNRAVEALIDRFRPRLVRLLVQPGWTVIDAKGLQAVITRTETPMHVLADHPGDGQGVRYRHGKLVEWSHAGGRWALTGSPNLSGAALLSAATQGNYELGIVTPVEHTLFPTGTPLSAQDVPTVTLASDTARSARRSRPIVLAAVRHAAGLGLTLNAPWASALEVQVSERSDPPDSWRRLGVLLPETIEAVIEGEVPSRSRVRLQGQSADGGRCESPIVFVTDQQTVMRRVISAPASRVRGAEPSALWSRDLTLLNALADDLGRLAKDVAATRLPPSHPKGGVDDDTSSEPTRFRDSDVDPWLWAQDDAIDRHGPGLATFALALPAVPRMGETGVAWLDRLVEEGEAALESDSADQATGDPEIARHLEEAAETETLPDHSEDPEPLRKARRRWCEQAVALTPHLPLPSRLLVLRLTLAFWSSGNWSEGDSEPLRLVETAVRALVQRGIPSELEARVGSLSAVAFSMVRDRVNLEQRTEGSLIYQRLVKDLAYVTISADEALIAEYVRFQQSATGFPLTADTVLALVHNLQADDSRLTDATTVLERHGWEVSRPVPAVLQVTGTFANPEMVALQAVGLVEDLDVVGAWAIGASGRWAFVGWRRPDLVTITPMQSGFRWRQHVLHALGGPAALYARIRLDPAESRFKRQEKPQSHPFAEALSILDSLGLKSPAPPGLSN